MSDKQSSLEHNDNLATIDVKNKKAKEIAEEKREEESLEEGLEDSMDASDPPAAIQP